MSSTARRHSESTRQKHSGGSACFHNRGSVSEPAPQEAVSAATPTTSAKAATPEQHSDDQHDSLAQHDSNPSKSDQQG
jgi:hypothetical protein